MRAFAVRSFGEAPALHDLPTPDGSGTFLVRVRFAGVNPADYKRIDRLTADSAFPSVVGVDFAGVLERVPPKERKLHVGDRVFGMARTFGSYAEYTAVGRGVTAEALALTPDVVTDEQAAALPVPAIAALRSLDLLRVGAGKRLVITGALGGVGGYAVQMARARGAHVIAIVRGNIDEARLLGADETYDASSGDVIDAVRISHPDGVDSVLDIVNGSDGIHRNAEILKPEGNLVSTVYAADEAWFAERGVTAHNVSSSTNPLSSERGLDEVASMLARGMITTRIRSTVELHGAGQILQRLRNGGLRGKAVIRLVP